jgi:aspartate carbamoyltransferase catalytic subunit
VTFAGKDFLRITDYARNDIEHVFEIAEQFEQTYRKREQKKMAEGKILATLFFQPSTRTQFSFQTAMLRLGGSTIGFAGTAYTSVTKGETLEDTIRMLDKYANIIVIRHPDPGSANIAAEVAEIPVINAGDGNNRHPTQALLDVYSIKKFKGKVDGVAVALWGDSRFSRVSHSLALALAMFGAHIMITYPRNLSLPDEILEEMRKKYGMTPRRVTPDEALKEADVLYDVGPLQDQMIGGKSVLSDQERAKITKELQTHFVLDLNRIKNAGVKEELIVMHPLPRHIDKLKPDIDPTKYCGYFEEAGYGVPVRMALMALQLGLVD